MIGPNEEPGGGTQEPSPQLQLNVTVPAKARQPWILFTDREHGWQAAGRSGALALWLAQRPRALWN